MRQYSHWKQIIQKSCPIKRVGNEVIKETDNKKYIGYYIRSKANSKDTLVARKAQRYGIEVSVVVIIFS